MGATDYRITTLTRGAQGLEDCPRGVNIATSRNGPSRRDREASIALLLTPEPERCSAQRPVSTRNATGPERKDCEGGQVDGGVSRAVVVDRPRLTDAGADLSDQIVPAKLVRVRTGSRSGKRKPLLPARPLFRRVTCLGQHLRGIRNKSIGNRPPPRLVNT